MYCVDVRENDKRTVFEFQVKRDALCFADKVAKHIKDGKCTAVRIISDDEVKEFTRLRLPCMI